MKHVCIVTSVHPWDDVRVASRIVTAFLDAGYRVTWVGPDSTLVENRAARLPTVDYRLFATQRGRVDRLLGAVRAERLARAVRDVDWWYSPDPDMAGRLPRLSRRKGGRTMFDVHESYHGGLLQRWFPGGRPPSFARKLTRLWISGTCRRVDLVIGVSSSVLEPYCAQQPDHLVVRNLAPKWFAPERAWPTKTNTGRMRILHGKLSDGNGTLQVATAVALLPEAIQRQIEVVMMAVAATPPTSLKEVRLLAKTLVSPALSTEPGVPHDRMADVMEACSVGLISYQRDLGHESLPNRLFEYMAAGLAILAPSYSPEIVAIIEDEEIGLTLDFEDPGEIARAIRWCVEHSTEVAEMGVRARRAYLQRYNWSREAQRLITTMARMEA